MKKFLLIALLFACTQISFAAFPPPIMPAATDNTAVVPSSLPTDTKHLTKEQKHQLMEQFSKLSVADYEKMTGKKLSGVQKLGFKMTQQRMKHQLKKDSTTAGFSIGGFLLGFFLFLIGVLIAYLVSSDSELRKWAWIGAGVSLVLGLLLAVI